MPKMSPHGVHPSEWIYSAFNNDFKFLFVWRSDRYSFSAFFRNFAFWMKKSNNHDDRDHMLHVRRSSYTLNSAIKSPQARRSSHSDFTRQDSPEISAMHVRKSSAFKLAPAESSSSPKLDHAVSHSTFAGKKKDPPELSQPLMESESKLWFSVDLIIYRGILLSADIGFRFLQKYIRLNHILPQSDFSVILLCTVTIM